MYASVWGGGTEESTSALPNMSSNIRSSAFMVYMMTWSFQLLLSFEGPVNRNNNPNHSSFSRVSENSGHNLVFKNITLVIRTKFFPRALLDNASLNDGSDV